MPDLKPQRIQLRRTRGFNLQAVSRALNGLDAVHCARPGRWGNPFRIEAADRKARRDAVLQFQLWLKTTSNGRLYLAAARRELRGKNLACWCPLPVIPHHADHCHAGLLLSLVNG